VYLGLDLGTTNIKALIVTDDGRIVARGSVPVSLKHTPDGGIEQNIEEIWRSTLSAIWLAGRDADLAAVRAIGVSSQGGAVQVRTCDGGCVGPVISWMDARGAPFDEQFQRRVGSDWLTPRVGHGESNMAVGQVLRLRQSDPTLLELPNTLGFVGDTIVQRLCGRAAHDASSLSICCLYNPSLRQADPDVLEHLGLRSEQLPDLLLSREPASVLDTGIASQTGLPEHIPVSPAIHDQYAAALGCGAISAGDVMFGAGTAWVLLAIADHLVAPVVPSAWVCDHVVPERWGQLLSLVVGGSAFKWALDMLGMTQAPPAKIDELIDSVPPGSDGLRLWPFLDAIGGPDRPSAGSLRGLRLSHGRGHLLRATIEGLCFELARQLGWLEKGGCPVRRLILCGGAAKSRCTPQIVADVTGWPVTCPAEAEISAFGASILARAMIERSASIEDLCSQMIGRTREIQPSDATTAYEAMVQEYVAAVARQANSP
jgi:sugar (pentulose or hexulose) kinase